MSAITPLVKHTGVAAALLSINIDTDAIIPSREMKKVSKEGLGEGLFANWRYLDLATRQEDPKFILNQAAFRSATILIAGDNFGCGSSREHAAWALKDYGIRVIVAPSFGSIFYGNCIRNGILPIRLSADAVNDIALQIESSPGVKLSADLVEQRLTTPSGLSLPFEIGPSDKQMLLEGLDGIAVTQKRDAEILAFIDCDQRQRPWAYL
jgi:3-isopropylmalate/(R)-2-methylmalate dehydratase small subunit